MITLNGIGLTFLDDTGELQAWLDRYQPLAEMIDSADPVSLRSNRPQTRSGALPGTGLPLPNYPAPPRPRINTLYWPTGASRWARGYFVVTKTQYLAIAGNLLAYEPQPITLRMVDEDNETSITATVYPLTPKLITPHRTPQQTAESPDTEDLYLLPVVDERYYWQFRNTGSLTVSLTTTWSQLYRSLETRLGVTIRDDAVEADYYQPDPEEFSRPYENAAIMLDAVAHSCGQRILRNLNGTVSATNWTNTECIYTYNTTSKLLIAGGEAYLIGQEQPAGSVLVTFPRSTDGEVADNAVPYIVQVTELADVPTVKVIHSSARALMSGSEPTNATELDALAEQIAADYYLSVSKLYDYTFPSIKNWEPCGYDDHILWSFGSLLQGEYQAQTRVQSVPGNFGDEEQLQQFSALIAAATTTTTSSTTTPGPEFPPSDCTGGPQKWEWDGTAWYPTGDGCNPSTTTSSTTSTSSTSSTSTTAAPALIGRCAAAYTSTSSTSTSSTSSTTTPAPTECHANYPTFCGSTVGQCTYTDCTRSISVSGNYTCPSSTTSSSTSTTLPCTSSTVPPGLNCGTGCNWKWSPLQTWILIDSDCGSYIGTCGFQYCQECARPSVSSTDACAADCPETFTPCITLVPPAPGTPVPCGGDCCWWWYPTDSTWRLTAESCTDDATCASCLPLGCGYQATIDSGCGCEPPAEDGTGWCDVRTTPCGNKCECEAPPDPCATTPAPTTSSSTTPNPCGTGCEFQGDGSAGWTQNTDDCVPGCACSAPPQPSKDNCEVKYRPCVPVSSTSSTTSTSSTSTSSTSTSSTTSTSSSTTTTTPAPWYCINPTCTIEAGNGSCAQVAGADVGSTANLCAGPYASEADCYAEGYCSTTTPSPTHYYCVRSAECDSYGSTCVERTEAEAAILLAEGFLCDGPYDNAFDCSFGLCGVTSTTSTSTTSTTSSTSTSTTTPPGWECVGSGISATCTYHADGGPWEFASESDCRNACGCNALLPDSCFGETSYGCGFQCINSQYVFYDWCAFNPAADCCTCPITAEEILATEGGGCSEGTRVDCQLGTTTPAP